MLYLNTLFLSPSPGYMGEGIWVIFVPIVILIILGVVSLIIAIKRMVTPKKTNDIAATPKAGEAEKPKPNTVPLSTIFMWLGALACAWLGFMFFKDLPIVHSQEIIITLLFFIPLIAVTIATLMRR